MIIIKPLLRGYAPAVLEIYAQGIATGIATFETEIPSWEQFDLKFLKTPRLVAMDDNIVTGWAMLSAVSARACYSGVAEVTVYVHEGYRNKGIGKLLLNELITQSEQAGTWSLLSVIHEENKSSIRLHQLCGFRIIGYRERIARVNGAWRTTVMMERRSKVTGIE